MKLEILLSTMNRNDIDDVFFEERKISGPCVVVNQNKEKDETVVFKNKKIVNTKTKGLSVSRNIALDNADGDICLIHDDDLYLEDNYENIILKYYKDYPDADIITFLITMGGEVSDRVNSSEVIKHNKHSILSIGSNEITFKKDSIKKNNLLFNTNFGLGSNRFTTGEESLFLSEAYKCKLKMYHVPIVISHHIPKYGSNSFWDEKLIVSKSAFFRAYDRHLWLAYMIYLYIRKRNLIDSDISFKKYVSLCFKGKNEYDKTK